MNEGNDPQEGRQDMRPLKMLISFEEARARVLSAIRPIERVEDVPLASLGGRVTAEDVVSPIDVPPFDRAAMDGFAVIASDTYGARPMHPVRLRMTGRVDAGMVPTGKVSPGECFQIATGAPMPADADAVVMVEQTETHGETVNVHEAVHPNQNVTPCGGDVRKGERVLKRGSLLTPARVGVCAALGISTVKVYARPLVGMLPSGEEVVPPGSPLPPGKIYDVNTYTLWSLISRHGCEVKVYPAIPDEPQAVERSLSLAVRECDMTVISGGSSVGARDHISDVAARMGEVGFHGVAVKPGKPTLFALIEGKAVLGMPGYPTSCLTNGYALLVDAVRVLARLPPHRPLVVKLPMAHRIVSAIGRYHLLPVSIDGGEVRSSFKESGAITSMSGADGYISIPANVDIVEKGELVDVVLF